MNKDIIFRFDFVFSYWIFVWYLLYEFKYVKYSPKLALIIGLSINLVVMLIMVYYNNSLRNILLFFIVQIFLKIIPLWRLRNNNIYDFKSLIILYIIYIVWLFIHNKNSYMFYKIQLEYIKKNKEIGPITHFINNLNK